MELQELAQVVSIDGLFKVVLDELSTLPGVEDRRARVHECSKYHVEDHSELKPLEGHDSDMAIQDSRLSVPSEEHILVARVHYSKVQTDDRVEDRDATGVHETDENNSQKVAVSVHHVVFEISILVFVVNLSQLFSPLARYVAAPIAAAHAGKGPMESKVTEVDTEHH